MSVVPQFGQPLVGKAYPDRPAAFAVIEREGKMAIVQVTFEGGGGRVDLPGGGVDEGETPQAAAIRECGEEAGLKVRIGELVVHADHYFLNEHGVGCNTRGSFFAATVEAVAPELKTEQDHALVWMDPHEALLKLDRGSHVWALACWLRLRARG